MRPFKRLACVISAVGLVSLNLPAQPGGAPVRVPGFLKFEAYNAIQSTPVQNLLDDPKYPNSPDEVLYMTAFNTRTVYPNDGHDNYGARITGLITPTESGDYEFFLRSDDASQLFINKTGEDLAAVELIAEETGCCNAFQETGATQTSPPITLQGGK
ncbi:MAG: PA14 domain-containing protein [Verrucomicrobiales bacterium]|nr:PA14 domain-containing protein [Verrucomicrobiales bacterium]